MNMISNIRHKFEANFRTKLLKSDHTNDKTSLKFTTGSSYLPKDNKDGEDAHFICNTMNVIGVADGVGSWAEEGVDAGLYARELMTNCVTAVVSQEKGSINPAKILQSAYKKTMESSIEGSSTACIIVLNKKNVLRYANLGDSGFILFRGEKILYQSLVQHHEFNFPYQLGSGYNSDTPKAAYEKKIHVMDGDIVVAASDGLFDNVYSHEIEKILNQNKNDHPDKLAREIAECALSNSKDREYFSPYAKAARKARVKHMGEKHDDITVIVAKIEYSSS